jgi:hypothetical protein
LDQLARQQPLLLVVDDAHLLDEHSAIVLHRVVVRRLAPAVVTIRAGEPALDIVTSLWKDDHLPRLDLAPLDVAETAGLVARVLGGPVDSASAQRLWTLTQGSPLFLRHVLAGEVSAGRFTAASGIWRWTSEPSISPELASLLEQEIGGLAAGVQEVVDLVALAEPLTVATLAGTPDRAAEQARRMRASSADLPGPARLMGLVITGHAALSGGRVRDALFLLREAWAWLADSGHEARFRCRTLLATALGQAGQTEQAAPLPTGIVAEGHPAYRLFRPDDLLARAWERPPRDRRPRR